MELPKELLDIIITRTENYFQGFRRGKLFSDSDEMIVNMTKSLYKLDKKDVEVNWLTNCHEVKGKLFKVEKPWVYHYSLNLNWVIFFENFYDIIIRDRSPEINFYLSKHIRDEFRKENRQLYDKVSLLRRILEQADGIIEDGNNIYLVKDDVNFIKPDLDKWMI